MKSLCFNQSTTNCTRSVKSCIVAVFSLFSFSAIAQEDANTAAIASDVESILQALNWALRNPVTSSPGYIPDCLDDLLEYDTATYKFLTGRTSTTASINYNDKNALPYLIGSLVYGMTGWAPNSSQPLDHSLHGDLTTGNQTLAQLLALLHNISNVVAQSASTVVVSNFVSVTNSGGGVLSPDILAANPWWATNSAFVPSLQYIDLAYPEDIAGNAGLMSFPEFMSIWSGRLSAPYSRPTVAQLSDRDSWWGIDAYLRETSVSGKINRSYTFFDWLADYLKSNRVQRAYTDSLILGVSNEVFNTGNYIVNHLDSGFEDLTNILTRLSKSEDILAANPWWETNSAFVSNWSLLRLGAAYPDGTFNALSTMTFPEAFSLFLSSRTADASISGYPLWYRWGESGQNYSNGRVWTFEDWLADAFKSNLVLVTSYGLTTGTNDLLSVSQSTGAETIIDDGETTNTNVLDELTLEQADTDAISGLTDFIDADRVGGMFDSMDVTPDPQLCLFPGGRYGDVTVDAVYADFTLPDNVASIISLAARWLWHILVMVSLFFIVRQEFDYWSTLGGSAGA